MFGVPFQQATNINLPDWRQRLRLVARTKYTGSCISAPVFCSSVIKLNQNEDQGDVVDLTEENQESDKAQAVPCISRYTCLICFSRFQRRADFLQHRLVCPIKIPSKEVVIVDSDDESQTSITTQPPDIPEQQDVSSSLPVTQTEIQPSQAQSKPKKTLLKSSTPVASSILDSKWLALQQEQTFAGYYFVSKEGVLTPTPPDFNPVQNKSEFAGCLVVSQDGTLKPVSSPPPFTPVQATDSQMYLVVPDNEFQNSEINESQTLQGQESGNQLIQLDQYSSYPSQLGGVACSQPELQQMVVLQTLESRESHSQPVPYQYVNHLVPQEPVNQPQIQMRAFSRIEDNTSSQPQDVKPPISSSRFRFNVSQKQAPQLKTRNQPVTTNKQRLKATITDVKQNAPVMRNDLDAYLTGMAAVTNQPIDRNPKAQKGHNIQQPIDILFHDRIIGLDISQNHPKAQNVQYTQQLVGLAYPDGIVGVNAETNVQISQNNSEVGLTISRLQMPSGKQPKPHTNKKPKAQKKQCVMQFKGGAHPGETNTQISQNHPASHSIGTESNTKQMQIRKRLKSPPRGKKIQQLMGRIGNDGTIFMNSTTDADSLEIIGTVSDDGKIVLNKTAKALMGDPLAIVSDDGTVVFTEGVNFVNEPTSTSNEPAMTGNGSEYRDVTPKITSVMSLGSKPQAQSTQSDGVTLVKIASDDIEATDANDIESALPMSLIIRENNKQGREQADVIEL